MTIKTRIVNPNDKMAKTLLKRGFYVKKAGQKSRPLWQLLMKFCRGS